MRSGGVEPRAGVDTPVPKTCGMDALVSGTVISGGAYDGLRRHEDRFLALRRVRRARGPAYAGFWGTIAVSVAGARMARTRAYCSNGVRSFPWDRLAHDAHRAVALPQAVGGGRVAGAGRRHSRRALRDATTAVGAPRRGLPPCRRGKSGAKTPAAWRRPASGTRRRRRRRRGAKAGAAVRRGAAVARFLVLCGGCAGSSAGPMGDRLAHAARCASFAPPSSSAAVLTPGGGGLPVGRFAM